MTLTQWKRLVDAVCPGAAIEEVNGELRIYTNLQVSDDGKRVVRWRDPDFG